MLRQAIDVLEPCNGQDSTTSGGWDVCRGSERLSDPLLVKFRLDCSVFNKMGGNGELSSVGN